MYAAVIVIAAMFVQTATAQPSEADKARMKAQREQLNQTRVQLLKEELKLTDAQVVKFEPVYNAYRKDLQHALNAKAARVKKEDLTNDNALEVINARLSNAISAASIKQRYLFEFARVIEPVQIEKLYRIDDRIAREARKIAQFRSNK